MLDVMDSAIAAPRTELSQYAPRIETIRINPDKIGLIIGPGGKTIKGIVAETGAEINIEDDGSVHIYSNNGDSLLRAKQMIQGMTKEIEVGEVYQGRVVTIKEFGCFVEVLPGKDGMVPHQRTGRFPRQPRGRRGQARRSDLGQMHRRR